MVMLVIISPRTALNSALKQKKFREAHDAAKRSAPGRCEGVHVC
jgi:hypothetical protein